MWLVILNKEFGVVLSQLHWKIWKQSLQDWKAARVQLARHFKQGYILQGRYMQEWYHGQVSSEWPLLLNFSLQKVNAHLKRSDNELAQLNTTLNKISMEARSFAPTITTPPRQDATPPKPPSQTHPLFVPSLLSTSYVNYWAAGVGNWFHYLFCVDVNFTFNWLLILDSPLCLLVLWNNVYYSHSQVKCLMKLYIGNYWNYN